MKKIITLIFLLGMLTAGAQAQGSQQDGAARQMAQNEEEKLVVSGEMVDYFSKSILFTNAKRLAADANSVAIINTFGDGNVTTIKQIGSSNLGVIKIRGDKNETSLTQNGANLLSFIGVEGSLNELDVTQKGASLSNYILLKGVGVEFEILQTAQGIMLTQMGGSSIPLKIKRSGRSVPIIISN